MVQSWPAFLEPRSSEVMYRHYSRGGIQFIASDVTELIS